MLLEMAAKYFDIHSTSSTQLLLSLRKGGMIYCGMRDGFMRARGGGWCRNMEVWAAEVLTYRCRERVRLLCFPSPCSVCSKVARNVTYVYSPRAVCFVALRRGSNASTHV